MLSDSRDFAVIVPTFRRPQLLEECLLALDAQLLSPREIIVVVRSDDYETKRQLEMQHTVLPKPTCIEVGAPGVIAAMRAGVAASTAPLIAFTDDDSRPRPDWLERIATHFNDASVGAVGGRDLIPGQEAPLRSRVGRYTWFGKLVGNHHLGTGPAREVDVLKGVNMAFRSTALALPGSGVLRGDGAEVDFELLTCAWARSHGWRLVYDPAIVVDHWGAPRHGRDQRQAPDPQAVFDAAYNSFTAVAAVSGNVPRGHAAYSILIGSRDRPGLGRAVAASVRGEPGILPRLVPSLAGRIAALQSSRSLSTNGHPTAIPAAALRASMPEGPPCHPEPASARRSES